MTKYWLIGEIKMKNGIYHSAEGSTWTKKNHKYIRKEGNRYIYPEDVKNGRSQAENRSNAMNNQGSADYKQLSQQRLNRKAAANGQIVNPTATWRGSDGRVIAREKTNEKISAPTASDYRKYSQLRGGAANRSRAMSNQRSTDYKQLSQQHADHQKELRELREMGSRKSGNQAVQNAKNAQNRAKESKSRVSKEYAEALRGNTSSKSEYWDQIKNRTGMHTKPKSNVSNKSDYEQELEANSRKNDGSKPTASKSNKVETWDNSKNIRTWDDVDKEIDKKSTNGQNGVFTLGEDGQTKFVPESENKPKKKTNKALEKGKEAISKIKNAFRKKTDREKGVVSTREYRDYGKVNPGTLKEQMIRDGSANREHYDYSTNRQALYNNEESRKKAEKKYRKGKSRYEPVSEYDNGYDPDTDSKRFRERYEEKKRRR